MPTDAEMTELRENCTWKWTIQNGINGYEVTSNNNSIFIPAAGMRYDSLLDDVGSFGHYWSSSRHIDRSDLVWCVFFGSDKVWKNVGKRSHGFNVRPVCP